MARSTWSVVAGLCWLKCSEIASELRQQNTREYALAFHPNATSPVTND